MGRRCRHAGRRCCRCAMARCCWRWAWPGVVPAGTNGEPKPPAMNADTRIRPPLGLAGRAGAVQPPLPSWCCCAPGHACCWAGRPRGCSSTPASRRPFPTSHPYIPTSWRHQAELSGLGNAVRIAVANPEGSIYDAKYLDTLRRLSDEVFLLPGVDRAPDEVAVDAHHALGRRHRRRPGRRPGDPRRLRRLARQAAAAAPPTWRARARSARSWRATRAPA